MQVLFSLIVKLCALVMIATLADLLMPASDMRKYTRLACGMLVLHIMVSQVFVLFGRAAPDVEAAQWTQLLGEVQSLPQQKGEAAALDAYHRQAQQLIINRSGKLGIVPESVSIAWDGAQRVQAVILHMPEEAVAALGQTQSASMAVAASDPEAVRTSIAQMLNLPAYAVQIQRGGERLP